MEINNPLLPKFRCGYYIIKNDINHEYNILAGIFNPKFGITRNNIIKIAPFTIYETLSGHLERMDNGQNYIYEDVNVKDFFATRQQAENVIKERTK